MTRVSEIADWSPTMLHGIGGNVYVICKSKAPLSQICVMINKAQRSIYWNKKHQCFVFRVKCRRHKTHLISQFGDIKYSWED